jgi:hypothetical protein
VSCGPVFKSSDEMDRGKTLKRYFCAFLLFVFPNLALAAVNCPGGATPNQYGFCGVYSASQIACQSKSANGCSQPSGSANIGFYTVSPAAGTAGTEFPGIAYSNFSGAPAYDTVNGNGAVGQKQVLEFVNNGIQAYDKTKGTPIFVKNGSKTPTPQSPSRPWASYSGSPLTANCGSLSIDVNATYDREDAVFILSGISNSGSKNVPAICIAASTQDNLLGTNGRSYWNGYGFTLENMIVSDSGVNAYFDYPRFGTFGNNFYLGMDYIDNTVGSADYQHILGYVVCMLDKSDIIAGRPASSAQCAVYLPTRTSGFDSIIHSLLPADMDSTTVAPNTQGEYFLGQVNPVAAGTNWTQGSNCYKSYSCASSAELLLWNWSQISSGQPGSVISSTFMPGCYNPWKPSDTFCVFQPSPATSAQVLDGLSDRVSGRFAYRYDNSILSQEILAGTNTVWNGNGTQAAPQQTVQYSVLMANPGAFPALAASGTFPAADATWAGWTASVAINSQDTLGLTFTEDDSGTATALPPSIYSAQIVYDSATSTWNPQSSALVLEGTGVSIGSPTYVPDWGNYVSVALDPANNLEFWGVNEYLNGNQTRSALTWATEIFNFSSSSKKANVK